MKAKIKIMAFGENVGYQCGGAERSTFTLLSYFKAADISALHCEDVKKNLCFKRLPYPKAQTMDTVKLPRFPYLQFWINSFRRREVIEKTRNVDLLFSQGLYAAMAINAFNGPSIYTLTDESALNITRCYEHRVIKKIKYWVRYLLQFPFYIYYCLENKKAIQKASVVIAYSQYYVNRVQELFGRKAELLYTFVDFQRLDKSKMPPFDQRPYIMMVGDDGIKGIRMFEKIAAQLPNHEFMIVGKRGLKGWVKNIYYRGYADDPNEIYCESKIVLMPSLWEEALGMTAIEALSLGIPALVSGRGGLPETVPKEFVVEPYNHVRAWVEKIEWLIKNPNVMAGLDINLDKFNNQKQYHKLLDIIEQSTEIDSSSLKEGLK